MKKKRKKTKTRNFVAKHMNTFNKPKTEVDKKKRERLGYTKHKHDYEVTDD